MEKLGARITKKRTSGIRGMGLERVALSEQGEKTQWERQLRARPSSKQGGGGWAGRDREVADGDRLGRRVEGHFLVGSTEK